MSKKTSKREAEESTTWMERFQQALQILCKGNLPPIELCESWMNSESIELQDWACCNMGAQWGTGIGTIDAAYALADAPEEGKGHKLRFKQCN